MKKLIAALLFSCALLSFGGCKPAMNKALEGKKGLYAVIETGSGEIVVELFYKQTPLTVTNFVGLAEGTLDAAKGKHFYDGLKFHRVISRANGDPQDFMIQGGDPKGNGTGGPGYKFADEFVDGLAFDKPGYLAMANSGSNTNGSQFFITIVPTEWLTGKHTIFGQVVDAQSQKVVNTLKQNTVIKKVTIYRLGEDAEKFSAKQADFDREQANLVKRAENEKKEYIAAQVDYIEEHYKGFTKDASGIYYKIEKEGDGNKAGKFKNVTTGYRGYFIEGTVFDPGSDPLDFTTAGGRMIPGFDLMTQDMKVGEKRTVILPPEYGYGESGVGGVIPGNTYIMFDIELISVK